ncbi:hypothetical protein [Cellulomonas olei]|uniref:hypothetical protein n=1 Tax=Cellulomonas sp. P4 TaxID=3142533 RepID=UPI0031B9F55C
MNSTGRPDRAPEGLPAGPEEIIEDHGPLTVLFRPDTPQPSVAGDRCDRHPDPTTRTWGARAETATSIAVQTSTGEHITDRDAEWVARTLNAAGAALDREALARVVGDALTDLLGETFSPSVMDGLACELGERILAARGDAATPALRPHERYRVVDADGRCWQDTGSNATDALKSARKHQQRVASEGWGPDPRLLQMWSTDPVEPVVEWREVEGGEQP